MSSRNNSERNWSSKHKTLCKDLAHSKCRKTRIHQQRERNSWQIRTIQPRHSRTLQRKEHRLEACNCHQHHHKRWQSYHLQRLQHHQQFLDQFSRSRCHDRRTTQELDRIQHTIEKSIWLTACNRFLHIQRTHSKTIRLRCSLQVQFETFWQQCLRPHQVWRLTRFFRHKIWCIPLRIVQRRTRSTIENNKTFKRWKQND